MSLDTYESLWRAVLLRCPLAGPFLARDWCSWAFRQIAERRRWSWLQKSGQFVVYDSVTAGTVTCTLGSTLVTGAGTTWDLTLIGRQFRAGFQAPIYTIVAVDVGAQTLTLDQPWGMATLTGSTYEIYMAYVTAPADFHAFISVIDPGYNWRLHTLPQQADLDMWDAQRSNASSAWVVAFRDYDPLAATGTPPLPRFELWPHQKSQRVYPYLYEARATDLTDSGATLPRYIRGDVLLEGALNQCALWPGPSRDQVNPYFNLALADRHLKKFEGMVNELELADDNLRDESVSYQRWQGLPFAPLPVADAAWAQRHAL